MDVNKVQALSLYLLGLAVLQQTDKTYVSRDILTVKTLIDKELGLQKSN
ncbi:hypothetical protein M3172_04920 [Mesobacillus subterraneus]|nr:hypothetical protein [Mesobacillus subterraneus]MCM3572521.1 hypothetical protein [Mesobacillus subterraneus]